MKLARILDKNGCVHWGVQGEDGELRRCEGVDLRDLSKTVVTREKLAVASYLPPVEVTAIFCIAGNYLKHIEESSAEEYPQPVVFMKNPAAAVGHGQPIRIPSICEDEVDYEGELTVVIGKDCRDATPREAAAAIAGYTIANDVSARIWQKERGGGQWVRGKGFDTFAPMGPFLVTPDEIDDVGQLSLKTFYNGEIVQDTSTSLMMRSVIELICFLSEGTTLLSGTVILTGTPEGVGWFRNPRLTLNSGVTISVEIEKLGTLTNTVCR